MPVRYYVLADDGQKYGPADIATLNTWIADSRLLPHQMLEEEASGVRIAARAVSGLNFPTVAAGPADVPNAPGGTVYNAYPRGNVAEGEDGSRDMTVAWVLFGVGLLGCCFSGYGGFLLPGIGIYYANRARQKGHPKAGTAFGLNVGLFTISVLLFIASMVFLAMVKSGNFPLPTRTR